MSNESETTLCVRPEGVVVTRPGDQAETALRYVEYPEVRDAARDLIRFIAEFFERELFFDICGQCGTCCRGRSVPVNAHEIVQISRYLGLGEDEFRKKHTVPASTWNDKDGILRNEDGACTFLEHECTQRYICSIYSVRPWACFAILPVMDICKKSREKLIVHIDALEIEGNQITISRRSGFPIHKQLENPLLSSKVEALRTSVAARDAGKPGKIEAIISEAHRLIDELAGDFSESGVRPELIRRIQAMKGVISDLDCLSLTHVKNPRSLEELWIKLEELSERVRERARLESRSTAPRQDEKTKGHAHDITLNGIRILPEIIFLMWRRHGQDFTGNFSYRDNRELMMAVRAFLRLLISSGYRHLMEAMRHPDPECIMCGDCCRAFVLEISPVDVERIAHHLNTTEEALKEKYMTAGTYSWNDGDALITRETGEDNVRQCPFLMKDSDTRFHCSIYEARPRICREYEVSNHLCLRKSLKIAWYDHVRNIMNVDIMNGTLYLNTCTTIADGSPPLEIEMSKVDDLTEIFHSLNSEICRMLQKYHAPAGVGKE